MKTTAKFVIYASIFFYFLWAGSVFKISTAFAATLFLLPQSEEYAIGKTFTVEARIDSEGQGFNAAQATLLFPKDILEVKSIDSSPSASVFNFWLEEPKFSNSDGKITFIGGTSSGVTGASVQILKINFAAKGGGDALLAISDAAVTAADGSGSNILSTVKPARFLVTPTVVEPVATTPTQPSTVTTSSVGLPPPAQIIRKPVSAQKLPTKPAINVPAYPDSAQWYNFTTNFLAQWALPVDVSSVATAINKDQSFTPSRSEGLFEAKTFPDLADGIWYLHGRFKNNVGWGPTAHYRIFIDTAPPLPFNINVPEGTATDNPTPILEFKTEDGLSGLEQYIIRVDDGEIIAQASDTIKLFPQTPGTHRILVKAVDKAGNMRETGLDLEILPIASPLITLVRNDLFVGEGNLFISGTTLPDVMVMAVLKNSAGIAMMQLNEKPDANGNWHALFDMPLKKGAYFVEITVRDERGALSLSVKSELLQVKVKPALVLGSIEITEVWFYVASILLLSAGIIVGLILRFSFLTQTGRKIVIAERDIINAFTMIKKDIDKILKNYTAGRLSKRDAETKFFLNKIDNDIEKMEDYILENIKEINK